MRVLLDTNVIVDFVLERDPHVAAAAELFELNATGRYQRFVSSITPINVFYIGRKAVGAEKARERVRDLLVAFEVCPITTGSLTDALSLPFSDYEDAVQHACAVQNTLDAIVTRDTDDYRKAVLPVFTPVEFLRLLQAKTKVQT